MSTDDTLRTQRGIQQRQDRADAESKGGEKKGDGEAVQFISQAVIETGACDEVRRRAGIYTQTAVEALSSLVPGPARVLLENVASELARRAA